MGQFPMIEYSEEFNGQHRWSQQSILSYWEAIWKREREREIKKLGNNRQRLVMIDERRERDK